MLQRVSIQNFKSLKDVTLDLQKVNLLIGPNNSGKTNFLKALEYYKQRCENEYYSFEDFDRVQYKHDKQFEIILSLTALQKNGNHLNVELLLTPDVNESEAQMWESSPKSDFISKRERFDLSDNTLRERKHNRLDDRQIQFMLIRGFIGIPAIHLLDAHKLSQPNKLDPRMWIENDGSNFTSFLFNLSQNELDSFQEIEKQLEKYTNEFSKILTPAVVTSEGAMLRLKLLDKQGNDYWIDEVSEGVTLFLGLLCIVYQPNPPKLLLLEEPERGIHPRRITEVMNFIYDLAENNDVQIILTTHNEHVLNDFATRPEAVFVFDKNEEGATEVRNLQKDIIEPSNSRSREAGFNGIDFTSNLGDNWLYGILGGVPENL
mgnify:CR=1 FL=1